MAEEKKALTLKEWLELQRVEEGVEATEEEGTVGTWSGASSSDAASSLGDSGAADDPEDLGDGGPAAWCLFDKHRLHRTYHKYFTERRHSSAEGGIRCAQHVLQQLSPCVETCVEPMPF